MAEHTFTSDEIDKMITVVAQLDAEEYPVERYRDVIGRCQLVAVGDIVNIVSVPE